jgi:hypothetical protein
MFTVAYTGITAQLKYHQNLHGGNSSCAVSGSNSIVTDTSVGAWLDWTVCHYVWHVDFVNDMNFL